MLRSWHRIFFLVPLLVVTCCLVSHAEKKAVGVRLPDGDVLPAFCFFPGEHVANPFPGVVVAANVGGKRLTQYHAYLP